jgi:hypothetical protein
MKISTGLLSLCGSVITLTTLCLSATQASDRTYIGYLLDKQCSDSVRHDSSPLDFIKHHTRDCCLMLNCQKKGYCLFADGAWLSLDSQGNKLAIEALKRSQKSSAIYVRILGSAKKGLLIAKSVVEVDEPSSSRDSGDGQNAK